MKSIYLITMLMTLFVQMPEKNVSALNLTISGFDVQEVTTGIPGKTVSWNRVDEKTCHIIIYGGKRVLTNEDRIEIKGYQTDDDVKMKYVTGASQEAEEIKIYNRYRRA